MARAYPAGQAVFATKIGYVQDIEIATLQTWAEKAGGRVVVAALPGTLATPDRPLAYIVSSRVDQATLHCKDVIEAFEIGTDRRFDNDPRFGWVVFAEIAGKALSTLASIGDKKMREAANYHRGLALECSRMAMTLPEDLAAVRDAADMKGT